MAPQPGDNQAVLLRVAAAGSSGRRSSERPAESGTERRRRDVGSSGAAGVVSRTIVSRTGQGAGPLKHSLLAARVAYGLGYSRRCRFLFHCYRPRNDRQRERALHSPAKRCRVVTAWPGCCQAVVRTREGLLARENPLAVVARAKSAFRCTSVKGILEVRASEWRFHAQTVVELRFVRQKVESTHGFFFSPPGMRAE